MAIGLDHALTYCQSGPTEAYVHLILRILKGCRDELKLEAVLRDRLASLVEMVEFDPWCAPEVLSEMRRSFVVPVAGLLVKFGSEAAQNREWRYD